MVVSYSSKQHGSLSIVLLLSTHPIMIPGQCLVFISTLVPTPGYLPSAPLTCGG